MDDVFEGKLTWQFEMLNHRLQKRSTLRAASFFAVLWCGMVGTSTDAQSVQRMTRSPSIIQKLQSRCRVTTSDSDLRDLADRIGQQSGVEIIVSRRLNPDLTAALRRSSGKMDLGPTLRDACDQLAKAAKCRWATEGNVIWLAPPGEAVTAMTSVLRLRQSLASASTFAREWSRKTNIEVLPLSEPRQVLTSIQSAWPQIELQLALPYDLLHGENFGPVDFPAAIGLFAGGFAMAVQPDAEATRLKAIELRGIQPVTIAYPRGSITARGIAQLKNVLGPSSRAQLQVSANALVLQGDAQEHLALQLQLWKDDTAANAGRQQLTFRFRNYARVGFEKLAEAGSFELTSDASVETALDKVVDVELQGETILQLLEQLAAEVGVTVQVNGTALKLTQP